MLLSVYMLVCASRTDKRLPQIASKRTLLYVSFWSLAMVWWPSVWMGITPADIRQLPLTLFGLAWPAVVCALHLLKSCLTCDGDIESIPRAAMHWDTNGIVGLCLTAGAFMSDAKVRSNKSMTQMLLAPIVLCLCLVVSLPFLATDTHLGVAIKLLHKLAITYAIGIVLTALAARASHPTVSNKPLRSSGAAE